MAEDDIWWPSRPRHRSLPGCKVAMIRFGRIRRLSKQLYEFNALEKIFRDSEALNQKRSSSMDQSRTGCIGGWT